MDLKRREFLMAAGVGTIGASAATAAGDDGGSGAVAASTDPNRSISGSAAISVREGGPDAPPLAPPDEQPPNLDVPTPPEKTLGWALVGLGTLTLDEIMPSFGACRLSKPTALVSGHRDKAERVADAYGISRDAIYSYDDYDRIAGDDRIDVVYNVLPNNMHAEYTIRAMEAGKDVLCEKPMAVTVGECDDMIAAAERTGRKLGIAYRLHHEPMNTSVMAMCRNQSFGKLLTIESSFCIPIEAPNIRLSAKLGGGPLGDIGVYCLNALRYISGEEPVEVFGQAHQTDDSKFREVPERVQFTCKFPSGVLGHADCSFGGGNGSQFRVNCENGIIEMSPAFEYRGLRLTTQSQHDLPDGSKRPVKVEHQITEVDQFAAEMDAFSRAVIDNEPYATEGDHGRQDMVLMAAINQSIRESRPVRLG